MKEEFKPTENHFPLTLPSSKVVRGYVMKETKPVRWVAMRADGSFAGQFKTRKEAEHAVFFLAGREFQKEDENKEAVKKERTRISQFESDELIEALFGGDRDDFDGDDAMRLMSKHFEHELVNFADEHVDGLAADGVIAMTDTDHVVHLESNVGDDLKTAAHFFVRGNNDEFVKYFSRFQREVIPHA